MLINFINIFPPFYCKMKKLTILYVSHSRRPNATRITKFIKKNNPSFIVGESIRHAILAHVAGVNLEDFENNKVFHDSLSEIKKDDFFKKKTEEIISKLRSMFGVIEVPLTNRKYKNFSEAMIEFIKESYPNSRLTIDGFDKNSERILNEFTMLKSVFDETGDIELADELASLFSRFNKTREERMERILTALCQKHETIVFYVGFNHTGFRKIFPASKHIIQHRLSPKKEKDMLDIFFGKLLYYNSLEFDEKKEVLDKYKEFLLKSRNKKE